MFQASANSEYRTSFLKWRSIKVKEISKEVSATPDTERLSSNNEVFKVKEFHERCNIKGFQVKQIKKGESSLRRSMGGQRGVAVPSLLQTNCRQTILLRSKSNPQPDFVEIPSSGFGERYNIRSFCRSHGRKRARNLKAFGDTIEVDDVILEDVDRGGVTDMYIDIGDCSWICERCHATFWVWSRCRYGVSNVLDTTYWVFLRVRPHIDIFKYIVTGGGGTISHYGVYEVFWIRRIDQGSFGVLV
ncbi:hypothetical protein Tco_1327967 [Tanacetum coccineum]